MVECRDSIPEAFGLNQGLALYFSPPLSLAPNKNNLLGGVIEGFMDESPYGGGVYSILVYPTDRCKCVAV